MSLWNPISKETQSTGKSLWIKQDTPKMLQYGKYSVSHKCIQGPANLSYCILRHNSILLYTLKLLSSFTFQREQFCFIVHIMIISRIITKEKLNPPSIFSASRALQNSNFFKLILFCALKKKIHTTREDDLWNTMIQCLLNILQTDWRFSTSGEHLIWSSLGP